jgi:hypothetical protein
MLACRIEKGTFLMQTPQSNLIRITTVMNAWETLRPGKSFAGMTLDEYKRRVQPFPNFRLVRKGDTHAKVLLVDSSFFVTTSFNWLSFRGDPKQPMREEEGTMVEGPTLVEDYYQKLAARIAVAVSDP